MAEALPMRARVPRRSSVVRKVFLATAGALSLLLAAGSGYAIYAIHYAEGNVPVVCTGTHCPNDQGLQNVTTKPGECTKVSCNFLIVGSDTRAGLSPQEQAKFGNSKVVTGARSDTIIVVHVDPIHHRTVVLQIPRDLLVDIPGHGQNKINSAFSHGPDVLIQTIKELTGLDINHYVAINFVGFERIVDALGGVKICINKPMIDTLAGLHLPHAGCYDLKGAEALAFVRARHVQGDTIPDFSRISRQQQFMRVVIQKLLSFGVVVHFRSLVNAISHNLVRDDKLKLYDLQDLTRKLSGLGQTGVFFRVVPATPVSIGGVDYVRMEPDAKKLFAQIRSDQAPGGIGRESPSTNISPANIKVRVYDAGSNGSAQRVVTYLQDAGFLVLSLEPSPAGLTRTEIVYRRATNEEKNVVSSYLPNLHVAYGERITKRSGGNVVVVVGPDFKGIEF